MLRNLLSIVVMLFVTTAHAINVGEKAPDFTLSGLDGSSYNLAAYQGKVVYIFWFGYG